MSSNRGRSWRPEKRIAKNDSPKVLIYLTAAVLTGLVGTVLYLLIGRGVPLLHFVVVTEHDFHADETALTALPSGATTLNSSALSELFDLCRERNERQIGDGATFESVGEFINGNSLLVGERLFIYCAVEARCVPDKEHPGETILELLPARLSPQQPPTPFSKLLSDFKDGNSPQIVLLLEFTGRFPGLASGAINDDIQQQVRFDVKRAKVPGLTVICSHEHGERSWEYVSEPIATPSKEERQDHSTAPLFRGTAFGHFLQQALIEGGAGSAADLHEMLHKNVAEWVDRHFGEPQTVWMVSTNPADADSELLTIGRLPKQKIPITEVTSPDANAQKDSSEAESDDDSKSAKTSSNVIKDDGLDARLDRLLTQRDVLRDDTVAPVLYPGEWLLLHTNLLAAEHFAKNGNDQEFNSLHDDVLNKALKDLERRVAEYSQSPKQQFLAEWIVADSLVKLSEDETKQLKGTLYDFSVEPGKATSRLPVEIIEQEKLRQALSVMLTNDLRDLSKSIADQTPEAQSRLIQERLFLLQNLSSRWSGNVIPESWATIREVLRSDDVTWQTTVIKPLVRLLDLRHELLQLAAGRDSTGALIRQNEWRRISKDLDELLKTLHSAERWLCVGADGKILAEDRLDKAEKSLKQIREQVALGIRLTKIQDAQRFRIPYLIEYLALRLEEISLTDKEIAAVKEMAPKAIAGIVTVADFPVGQLNAIDFNRAHIEAMFELTRNFAKPESEVNEADEKHIAVLERFVADRLSSSMPASEAWQLLNTPLVRDREKLYQSFVQPRNAIRRVSPRATGRMGVWTSFWSLRLVEAVSQKLIKEDWELWSELVSSIGDAEEKKEVVRQRAAMSSLLRRRWIEAIQELRQFQNMDVFAPESERLQLLTGDLTRRLRTTSAENRSLYSRIQQVLSDGLLPTESASLTILNPNAELTSDYQVTTNLEVSNAAALYVLNKNVTLPNTDTTADRNWLRVPLNATGKTAVALEIGLQNAPLTPTQLKIVAVDEDGTPVHQEIATLQPPSENLWEISVAQVEEGNPNERPITLEVLDGRTHRRLRLLPSTIDPETNMDVPIQLRLRLHRTKGISKSVKIRALHADGKTEIWRASEPLKFSGDETVVEIPFSQPATPAATGSSDATVAVIPEISGGLIFEITPDDLPRKITSLFTITPRLLGPEDIVRKPVPKYESNDELVISLNRVQFDNSTVLWPKKLVAEVELSSKLMPYLQQGTPLKTLDADGFEFRIPFNSEIRKVLNEDRLEFGVSVGGIPHGWWWTLTQGTAKLLDGNRPQIRTFLTVVNPMEVTPIADSPNLLIGTGFEKAKMSARSFIHGGRLDGEWSMRTYFLRQNPPISIPAAEPFLVNGRYVESVKITPSANGLWQFSTTTSPYSIPEFTPEKYQLQNGTYSFNAMLEQRGKNADPILSDVEFTFDNTNPDLNADSVQLSKPKTSIKDKLTGTIKVKDDESGIRAVSVWLNPEIKVSLPITPGKEVNTKFTLDSTKGFPALKPTEKDEETTVTLHVEVENNAGGKKEIVIPVTFFVSGKAVPVPKVPGTILVTFNVSAPFKVSVTRDGVTLNMNGVVDSANFPGLPPGEYTVSWEPVQGTLGKGTETVTVVSGETVPAGPGKK